jgi:Family of unknown function (DUF6188)
MLPFVVADMGAERRSRQSQYINGQSHSIDLLIGQRLEYVGLGAVLVLSFTDGSQVLIESLAHLDGPDGRVDVEPGDHHSFDVLALLLGDVVRAAWTRGDGELRISFGRGSELVVGVDADVESWAVAGRNGVLMVCLAGGEVAVWGSQRR